MSNETGIGGAVPGAMPSLFNKRSVPTLLGITAAVWISAAMIGTWWSLVGAGVLTLAGAGGIWWLWRKTKKQAGLMQLLQQAQASPEAREAALAQLAAGEGKDDAVLAGLAKAQLQAQTDPDGAIETLSAIDLSKVPADAADQVRTFRVQLLLLKNRVREARDVADRIVITSGGPMQARAMTAAVVAEAYARTGAAEDALNTIAPFDPANPEIEQVQPLLLYARCFAMFGTGKKDSARKAMRQLMAIDPNLLGRFVAPGPGIHLELRKMATDLLRVAPGAKKMARAQQRPMHRRMR